MSQSPQKVIVLDNADRYKQKQKAYMGPIVYFGRRDR